VIKETFVTLLRLHYIKLIIMVLQYIYFVFV